MKNGKPKITVGTCLGFLLIAGIVLGIYLLIFRGPEFDKSRRIGLIYDSYVGPVYPLTAVDDAEGLQVSRRTDLDFSLYTGQPEDYSGLVIVTDSYRLTNSTDQTLSVRLAYPVYGHCSMPSQYFPTVTLNGAAVRTSLQASHDPKNTVRQAENFRQLANAMENGRFPELLFSGDTVGSQLMYVYRISSIRYSGPETEPSRVPDLQVNYQAEEDRIVWSYGTPWGGYPWSGTDQDNGTAFHKTSCWASSDSDGPEDLYLAVEGGPLQNMEITFTHRDSEIAAEGAKAITYELTEYTTTFSALVEELAQLHIQREDVTDPFEADSLADAALWINDPSLLSKHGGHINGIFDDITTWSRLLYTVFDVVLLPGEEAELDLVFYKSANTDISGKKEKRYGFDIATQLGSTLSFTEQVASVSNTEHIKIVRQNFGFDLEKGITSVVLNPKKARYFLDVVKVP